MASPSVISRNLHMQAGWIGMDAPITKLHSSAFRKYTVCHATYSGSDFGAVWQ